MQTKQSKTETRAAVALDPLVMPRRIAWATGSASNGYIYQWSRWHLAPSMIEPERTLCGMAIPHTKWITPIYPITGDYRIKGGECQECKRHNTERSDRRGGGSVA